MPLDFCSAEKFYNFKLNLYLQASEEESLGAKE